MVRSRHRQLVYRFPVFAFASWLACGSGKDEVRILDRACASNACSTSGTARYTTGIWPGATGIAVGPGPGTVQVPIEVSSTGTLEALVSGTGTLQSMCSWETSGQSTTLSTDGGLVDYQWVTLCVVTACDPTNPTGCSSQGSVQIGTQDSASAIDIADVQVKAFPQPGGCKG